MKDQYIKLLIWLITISTYALPLLAWFEARDWSLNNLEPINIFPLIGLLAFFQLWSLYAVKSIKRYRRIDFNFRRWFDVSMNLFLVWMLLHPALLLLASNKYELEPETYVGEENLVYLQFAYVAIAAFFIYELANRLKNLEVLKKHWDLIKTVNMAAFVAIYFHGLFLGQHLQSGWLRSVWYFLGFSFVVFTVQTFYLKFKNQNLES